MIDNWPLVKQADGYIIGTWHSAPGDCQKYTLMSHVKLGVGNSNKPYYQLEAPARWSSFPVLDHYIFDFCRLVSTCNNKVVPKVLGHPSKITWSTVHVYILLLLKRWWGHFRCGSIIYSMIFKVWYSNCKKWYLKGDGLISG